MKKKTDRQGVELLKVITRTLPAHGARSRPCLTALARVDRLSSSSQKIKKKNYTELKQSVFQSESEKHMSFSEQWNPQE